MNPKDRAGAKKPNLSVLPFAPLLDVIPALYEGRRKYGPWNWRAENVSETIYADAAIRHLIQFISGEDIDPDSGVHHISKAIAGLLVVRDAQMHGCSIDDRFVNQNLQIDKQIEQLAGVNERYPEPVESALPLREGSSVGDVAGFPTVVVNNVAPCCKDEGITGGSTMTPEDAEKVAEYLGLTKCRAPFDDTFAGGGSYQLTGSDVGKRVGLRNGTFGTIVEKVELTGWPFSIKREGSDQRVTVTSWGQASADQRDQDGYMHSENEDTDVVRVYHDGKAPGEKTLDRVERFDTSVLNVGDTVVFAGGVRGVISELDLADPEDPLVIAVTVEGQLGWYTREGTINHAERNVEHNHKQIISIVSGRHTQTRLTFLEGQ